MSRVGGMVNSSKANKPPRDISTDNRIQKFPVFSDMKLGKGSVKMKRMGMTALMTATS